MSISLIRKAQFQFWKYAEGRAIFELQSFYLLRGLLRKLPKGDGHPVIVFPGFVGSDSSTKPMRKLLDDLGYSTYGWGLGRNLTINDHREEQMLNLLRDVHKNEGRKVSLVGWSLGGVFAREIAKLTPEHVRSVVTLGSPISGNSAHSNADDLFRKLNGDPSDAMHKRMQNLNLPPPVPTTSIYSKTDGIVAWEGSVQSDAPLAENIEVPASHFGLGVNPLVMMLLADRLAQTESNWQPFERSGYRQLVFPDPKQSCSGNLVSAFQSSFG